MHAVNAAVSGLSALPSTARPMASVKAMSRFLGHDDVTLPALIEPAQEAVRDALASSSAAVALVVHDWCMLNYRTGNADRLRRSHATDLGYELGSALILDAATGQPLGPMELRLRTAAGTLSTRPTATAHPPGHVDELLDVMNDARTRWHLGKPLVHVIDREADSVDHYRQWSQRGHAFVVRADDDRVVTWQGRSCALREIVKSLEFQFRDVFGADGQVQRVTTQRGDGRVQATETMVTLDRPATKRVNGKQVKVPGVALPLRLVLGRVVDDLGVVRAQWLLFTSVGPEHDAATVTRWYAWRWRIESYHKLLKSAGMNAEAWEQESGEAVAKRLVVASMACLTVWHLQRDPSPAAGELRRILVRLSGRQMKHRVESTAPALLAGLEKLLALDDLQDQYDLREVLALARRVLPTLFRSG